MTKNITDILEETISPLVYKAVEDIITGKLKYHDKNFELIITKFSLSLFNEINKYSPNERNELLKTSVLMLMDSLKDECPFLTARVYYSHHLTASTRLVLARSLRRVLHLSDEEKSIITQATAGTSDEAPHISIDEGELISATQMSKVSVVQQLLENGVNVNTCRERPLLNAIENNRLDMVELLLKHGADHKFYFFEPIRTCLKLNNLKIGYHLAKLDNGIDIENWEKRIDITPEMARQIKEINTRIAYENLSNEILDKEKEPLNKKSPKI